METGANVVVARDEDVVFVDPRLPYEQAAAALIAALPGRDFELMCSLLRESEHRWFAYGRVPKVKF